MESLMSMDAVVYCFSALAIVLLIFSAFTLIRLERNYSAKMAALDDEKSNPSDDGGHDSSSVLSVLSTPTEVKTELFALANLSALFESDDSENEVDKVELKTEKNNKLPICDEHMDCSEPEDYDANSLTGSSEKLWRILDQHNTVVDTHTSSLPIDEVTRYRNTYAVQVLMPEAFRLILRWGCPNKRLDETYFEYLKREKSMSVRKLTKRHRLFKKYMQQITIEKESGNFDVTLLFFLIQVGCDDLLDRFDSGWNAEDDTKLECLLRQTKDLRNLICHGKVLNEGSVATFEKVIEMLQKIIQTSGAFYSQDQSEIDNELGKITRRVEELLRTSEEIKLVADQTSFVAQGQQESKSYWKKYCSEDMIPFSGEMVNREDVLHPMDISIRALTTSSNFQNIGTVMPCSKILDGWDGDSRARITILIGDAGSGKSTLVKNIAMQFFGLSKQKNKLSQAFDLMYFLECRDFHSEKFEEFLTGNFPETCKNLATPEIVKFFEFQKNLIIIDGYDERNEKSSELVKDIVRKCKIVPGNHILFTTRPHALKTLELRLKAQGVDYRICELLPITDQDDQLEFLERYENVTLVRATPSHGMSVAFRNLNADVRSFFIYPINLVLFYHLYLSSPEEVNNWRCANDVPRQILLQYKMVIEDKLQNTDIKNVRFVIGELLDEINCYAFETLSENKISLNSKEMESIQERCEARLSKHGLVNLIDCGGVLSVVFLTRFSPTSHTEIRHQFFHKNIQEMMSAKSILKDFKHNKDTPASVILLKKLQTTNSIQQNITTSEEGALNEKLLTKFLNVLKFVLMDLCEQHEERGIHGSNHIHELCNLLRDAGVSEFSGWAEIIVSCHNSMEVTERATEIVKESWWEVRTPEHCAIAAKMLPVGQPPILRLQLNPRDTSSLTDLLTAITDHHTRELRLLLPNSHDTYTPCDEIIAILRGSRCHLKWFRGCITSLAAAIDLLKLGRGDEGPFFIISLQRPHQHPLLRMQGSPHFLYVTMDHTALKPGQKYPLPKGTGPPELVIRNTPASGSAQAEMLILALAPEDTRFSELKLHHCSLSDDSLDNLLIRLHASWVRVTGGSLYSCTRWQQAGLGRDGECRECQSSHSGSVRCISFNIGPSQPQPNVPFSSDV